MLKVIVTTASPLPKKMAEAFQKSVAKKHGKDVQYDFRVDPSVVGGVKTVIGAQSVDATVAGKLATIKKQLLSQI